MVLYPLIRSGTPWKIPVAMASPITESFNSTSLNFSNISFWVFSISFSESFDFWVSWASPNCSKAVLPSWMILLSLKCYIFNEIIINMYSNILVFEIIVLYLKSYSHPYINKEWLAQLARHPPRNLRVKQEVGSSFTGSINS